MKIGIRNSMGKVFVILTLILAVGLFTAAESFSAEAKEIDASVDVALGRFYKDVKGAAGICEDRQGPVGSSGGDQGRIRLRRRIWRRSHADRGENGRLLQHCLGLLWSYYRRREEGHHHCLHDR